jgi:hypothetical protein
MKMLLSFLLAGVALGLWCDAKSDEYTWKLMKEQHAEVLSRLERLELKNPG